MPLFLFGGFHDTHTQSNHTPERNLGDREFASGIFEGTWGLWGGSYVTGHPSPVG